MPQHKIAAAKPYIPDQDEWDNTDVSTLSWDHAIVGNTVTKYSFVPELDLLNPHIPARRAEMMTTNMVIVVLLVHAGRCSTSVGYSIPSP